MQSSSQPSAETLRYATLGIRSPQQQHTLPHPYNSRWTNCWSLHTHSRTYLVPAAHNECTQVVAGATDYPLQPGLPPQQPQYDPGSFGGPDSSGRLGEAARQSLAKATSAMRRYGWIGFWVQLTLSVVSGVILLFSVAFTSQVRHVLQSVRIAAVAGSIALHAYW